MVWAGAPVRKQPITTRESRNGINTKTEANIPAVIPFNFLKFKDINRKPIRGNSGISQIYLSIMMILMVYHLSLFNTFISMVCVDL